MNREELRDLVLLHQFSPTQYTSFANTMLNEAQNRIARKARLRIFFATQSISTVAGTDTSALPTDFLRLYSLTNTTDSAPLNPLPLEEFDDLPTSSSSGKPTSYAVDRGNIKFYPVPDAVYPLQLRYYRSPVEMDGDSDEPEIPEAYQHVLVTYALARCYRRENDYRAADYHRSEFEREVGELMAELQDDTQDATYPQQVEGMWGSDGTTGIRVFIP